MKVDQSIGGINSRKRSPTKAKQKKKITDEIIPCYAGGLDEHFRKNKIGSVLLSDQVSMAGWKLDMVMGTLTFFECPKSACLAHRL